MDINELLIDENETIIGAMACLDRSAKKVLFIQKEDGLKASVTDGDIRRWILSSGDLNAPVRYAANYKPKYLPEEKRVEAKRFMKQNSIEALPIIDDKNRIKSVVLWDDLEILKRNEVLDIPVVMMAGGLGTRLYPYTQILPKPLIPIGEIPIAEHIINQFSQFGCKDYYLIVNHKKNMIKAYFNENERDYMIYYVDEDIPLGTGGGLSLLKGKINSTFILTNCDILIDEDICKIYRLHKEKKHMITMVCSLKVFEIPYGVVNIGNDGQIETMNEKPSLSFFTNTGCYIVEPEVIEDMEDNQQIDFPDIIEKYKKQDKKVGVYPISANAWFDMGSIDELEKMKEKLGKI